MKRKDECSEAPIKVIDFGLAELSDAKISRHIAQLRFQEVKQSTFKQNDERFESQRSKEY